MLIIQHELNVFKMCKKFMKTCSRHLLIVLNILFFIIGIGVLVLGTWISVDKKSLIDLISNTTSETNTSEDAEKVKTEVDYYFTFASLVIIGTGAFIVLLSLVGCFGAIKESKCLLILYALVVILITMAQSIGIILSAVYQEQLKNHISTTLQPFLQHYGNESDIKKIWDVKMTNLNCCGVKGWEDFKGLKPPTIEIAPVCCNPNQSCNVATISDNKNSSVPGCVEKVFTDMKDQWMHAIIIAAVVILIEILGIAFALGLTNSISNYSYEDDDYDGMQMEGTNRGGNRVDSMFSG